MKPGAKVDNWEMVACPHCATWVRVPIAVIRSNVTDWPCVKCHKRFAPRERHGRRSSPLWPGTPLVTAGAEPGGQGPSVGQGDGPPPSSRTSGRRP